MANTTTFETKFSKRMQVVHYKKDVFRGFASFEERSNLQQGQSVVRPYRSALVVSDYTRGSDATIQDTTDTNETLNVTIAKIAGFSVDDYDELQSNYKLQDEYARDAARGLGNEIDGRVLYEAAANAQNVVDNALFGGTSGDGIQVSAANIQSILFKVNQKLNERNIDVSERFGAISPQMQYAAQDYYAGRETVDGDKVGMNGYLMTRAGLDLSMSNNLYWSGLLSLATAPTDGDTVVINGVTFTFKTVLGSTAGNVLIGVSADAARLNLTTLLNAPGTTTSEGVALSAASQALLKNISGVNDASANTLTVTAIGKSYITVSETFTDATDGWSKQIQHNVFGRKGCVDVVIQKEPSVKVNPIPKQLGVYVLPNTLFGTKAFREGTLATVDVKIDTSAF